MTNNLIKRVMDAGKRIARPFALAGCFAASLLPNLACTGGGDSGGDDPEPDDSAVVWIGNYPATAATENSPFFCPSPGAYDPDGMPTVYSKIAGPTWVNVNPITGDLTGTPLDADVGASQTVTVRADDGTMPTDKTALISGIGNVADVTGYVDECGSGDPINGAEVKLGALTSYTDSFGEYTFNDVPDGDYALVARNPSVHVTHKQGTLQINQTREHANKLLNLETVLLPEAHFQFIEDTVRSPPVDDLTNFRIMKWNQKPVYDIYTQEVKDNLPVDSAKVDLVKSIIKNKISGNFYDSFGNLLTFTDADINEIAILPPAGQTADGHIKVCWNNNYSGGANTFWYTGDNINSAYARANTSLGENVWMQELTENMIAEGETNDAAYIDSVLHDPGSGAINYSVNDAVWIDFHKNRPIGNRDLKNADTEDRDVNPSGTYINP